MDNWRKEILNQYQTIKVYYYTFQSLFSPTVWDRNK